MTISGTLQEDTFQINSVFINDQTNRLIDQIIPQFDHVVKKYVYISLLFYLLLIGELCILISFLSFFLKSSLFAFSLALMFLTLFSFFFVRLYLKTKKPEQFQDVKKQYLSKFKQVIHYRDEIPEHLLALAQACTKFASALQGKEHRYYQFSLPSWMEAAAPALETFSLFWHWQDVLDMREILLRHAVDEHITLVKYAPTDLEVHAALANAYVTLSTLYTHFHQGDKGEESLWKPSKDLLESLENKFRATAKRAIEEFKILSDYAPNDPWVHTQLAYSYHDLGMPEEEIKAYETIISLCPNDRDALFKVGVLYFQHGHNAQGLQIYEKLKKANYKKAESLIAFYGENSH